MGELHGFEKRDEKGSVAANRAAIADDNAPNQHC